MKTVVIACGAGVATSTMVKLKVEDILKKNKIKANIIQTRLSELPGYDNKSDLFITTMKVDQKIQNSSCSRKLIFIRNKSR